MYNEEASRSCRSPAACTRARQKHRRVLRAARLNCLIRRSKSYDTGIYARYDTICKALSFSFSWCLLAGTPALTSPPLSRSLFLSAALSFPLASIGRRTHCCWGISNCCVPDGLYANVRARKRGAASYPRSRKDDRLPAITRALFCRFSARNDIFCLFLSLSLSFSFSHPAAAYPVAKYPGVVLTRRVITTALIF